MIHKLLDADKDGKIDLKDVKQRSSQVADEIRAKTIGYLTAAFGLVAGLAWNDAIKAFIEAYYPLAQDSVLAKFFYACAITMIVVLMTYALIKLAKNTEKE
jgi:ABC-type lipoprotein export system ATPase subunit